MRKYISRRPHIHVDMKYAYGFGVHDGHPTPHSLGEFNGRGMAGMAGTVPANKRM